MTTRYYWWIVSHVDGRPTLIFGSDRSEEEANQKALEWLNGIDFRIRRLPTRDPNAAARFLKGHRLEKGVGLKEASRKIGHEKSLKRWRRKAQRDMYQSAGW